MGGVAEPAVSQHGFLRGDSSLWFCRAHGAAKCGRGGRVSCPQRCIRHINAPLRASSHHYGSSISFPFRGVPVTFSAPNDPSPELAESLTASSPHGPLPTAGMTFNLQSGESFTATAGETNGAPGTSSRGLQALAGGVRRGSWAGPRVRASLVRGRSGAAQPSGPEGSCAA